MITEKGQVNHIIFRNEENGYTVIEFLCESGDSITAVGFLPEVCEGEILELTGEIVYQQKRGEQFVFESVKFIAPAGKAEIRDFLSSGLFPFIGPATAAKIVDALGDKTLIELDANPDILQTIKGIKQKTADKIAASYRLHKNIRDNMFFLQQYGISLSKSFKICETYGDEVKETINSNPYVLISDIEGIGFLTADKIAKNLGIDPTSEFRIKAAIGYILEKNSSTKGNTCLEKEKLIVLAKKLIEEVDIDSITDTVFQMLNEKELMEYNIEYMGVTYSLVALPINYNSEKSIAIRLSKLKTEASEEKFDVSEKISKYENKQNIFLHETQKQAIKNAINQGAMVITGGPGTGKTTIIKCILQINQEIGRETVLAAPTGRASKRLEETTGVPSSTIHRLLGVDMSKGRLKFNHNEFNPLTADTIILDEVSMADIYIFNALLKAIKRGGRLIIVGDKDQLPSVAAGNILGDIIASNALPVTYLTEIYRQEAGSLIVVNAHKINSGIMPTLDNASNDFYFVKTASQEEIVSAIKNLITERLPKFFSIKPIEIQVLSPTKIGSAGVVNLNKELQALLNINKPKITLELVSYKIGDKVMQNVNNYDIPWEKENGGYFESGEGVFNGELGIITDIFRGNIEVAFEDGKVATYGPGDHSNLMLAYAVSVHKSQGCEFPVVIIAICGSHFLMNRNLLYTAVTRAKQAVVIVGSTNDLSKMINNVHLEERKTLLQYFLFDEMKQGREGSVSLIKAALNKKKREDENLNKFLEEDI